MNRYVITDFGARADGTLCTRAIQAAIDACAATGGVVEVPAGTFVTGTLNLKSHVSLRLGRGAVLQGSESIGDYVSFGYTHNEWGDVKSLIWAMDAEDIGIEGDGVIDFSSDAFFDYSKPFNSSLDVAALTPAQAQEFEVRPSARPNQMIFFRHCRNVRARDVRLVNAACWSLVFSACEEVRLTGLVMRYSLRLPNDDGVHLCSCRNVIISDCDIVAGDDCIAISGIDDWQGISENIVITNCLMCSASAGVHIGYWHSRVRNVQISNCTIYDSTRGICMMSWGAGSVENVTISGVNIATRGRAGTWWGRGEAVFIAALPHEAHDVSGESGNREQRPVNVRNVTVRDMTATCEWGIIMLGNGHNIADMRFYNVDMTVVNSPNRAFFGNRLDVNPGKLVREAAPNEAYWLYAEQVSGLIIDDARVRSALTGDVDTMTEAMRDCERVALRGVERG